MHSKQFVTRKKKNKGVYPEANEGAENTSSSTDTRRNADEDAELIK